MAAKKKPKAKAKPKAKVAPGDVYAGPLMDGRFGAVRVVGIVGRSATLVTTHYIGATVPAIKDPALRKVLRQNRFFYENQPSVMVTDKPPPPTFVHVGNIPLNAKERARKLNPSFGGHWQVVEDVWLEWRWEHEREAFEAEVNAERAAEDAAPKRAPGPRKRTPRSTLTEDDFWTLIATVGAPPAVAPLVKALAKRSQADIREFHELLAHQLYLLDGKAFADRAGAAGGSDDAFLYARCHVVARGRTFFQNVLAHPEQFPIDVDFEDLLSAAPDAFTARTGEDLDDDTHFDYETGSNADGWP